MHTIRFQIPVPAYAILVGVLSLLSAPYPPRAGSFHPRCMPHVPGSQSLRSFPRHALRRRSERAPCPAPNKTIPSRPPPDKARLPPFTASSSKLQQPPTDHEARTRRTRVEHTACPISSPPECVQCSRPHSLARQANSPRIQTSRDVPRPIFSRRHIGRVCTRLLEVQGARGGRTGSSPAGREYDAAPRSCAGHPCPSAVAGSRRRQVSADGGRCIRGRGEPATGLRGDVPLR